eukprot:gene5211-7249_t
MTSINEIQRDFFLEEEEKKNSVNQSIDMDYILDRKPIFDEIMQSFPTTLGKAVSKREREEMKLKDSTLVYGEVTFETLGVIIEKIKKVYGRPNVGSSGPNGVLQDRGGLFYDLGSGTGKGVIGAAVLHNFDVCYGIELLEGLFSVSLDAINSYNTRGKAKLTGRSAETHCQMIHGDFLKVKFKDWRDADVVFVNSTCYDDNVMTELAQLAVGMKKGSFFVSLTKRLPTTDFEVLECEMAKMSWGDATLFIVQKTTEPRIDTFKYMNDEDDK